MLKESGGIWRIHWYFSQETRVTEMTVEDGAGIDARSYQRKWEQ